MIKTKLFLILPIFFLAIGCSTDPEPIRFGEEQCAFCKMNIVDQKFGAELVTEKGRVYKFDALECLIPYKTEHPEKYIHELAIAYDDPGQLHSVENLVFLRSESFNSPMGSNVAAFKNAESTQAQATEITWSELEEKFASGATE